LIGGLYNAYKFRRKLYRITKRLKTPEKVEEYFPVLYLSSIRQNNNSKIPKHVDNKRKRICSIWERRKEKYCYKDTQIMVNNQAISSFIN
jgi:hypothetical protein